MVMFQVSINLSFTQKALSRGHIVYQIRTDDFDGNLSAKGSALACQVYLAHTPDSNTAHQIIVAKALYTLPIQHEFVWISYGTILITHGSTSVIITSAFALITSRSNP